MRTLLANYIRHCIILLCYGNPFRLMAELSIEAKRTIQYSSGSLPFDGRQARSLAIYSATYIAI